MRKDKPIIYKDNRGYYSPIIKRDLVQINLSHSYKGVIRGMHTQINGYEQGKEIYILKGTINDVIHNPETNTTESFILNKGETLWVPRGYLHGFEVLTKQATILYGVDNVYSPENEVSILYNSIGYDWFTKNPVLSKKDKEGMSLEDFLRKSTKNRKE